jgi:hypothetical protein
LGVTALQKLSFQSLVLTRSVSVEAAAQRYGCSSRAVRRWCWTSPISCKIVGGTRRVSLPLADLFCAGFRREVWDFVMEGKPPSEAVIDAFSLYGALEAMLAA